VEMTQGRKAHLRAASGPVDVWCLLFVLIQQGLRGVSGPQRLIRSRGEETGNPIMAFHRPSFFPSFERETFRGHPAIL